MDDDKISVKDPAFVLTATFGRLFLMVYVICTVIVALNMLIAMMNNSFERIMVSSVRNYTVDPRNGSDHVKSKLLFMFRRDSRIKLIVELF